MPSVESDSLQALLGYSFHVMAHSAARVTHFSRQSAVKQGTFILLVNVHMQYSAQRIKVKTQAILHINTCLCKMMLLMSCGFLFWLMYNGGLVFVLSVGCAS